MVLHSHAHASGPSQSRSHKLAEYLAQKSLESGNYCLVIPVRVNPEQKELLIKYSMEEYGESNLSKYIRDYLEKHLFKMIPSEKTLIELKAGTK